ncbi:hypothetical protein AAMO2058_000844800 [Amorphochlora amoebiformis]
MGCPTRDRRVGLGRGLGNRQASCEKRAWLRHIMLGTGVFIISGYVGGGGWRSSGRDRRGAFGLAGAGRDFLAGDFIGRGGMREGLLGASPTNNKISGCYTKNTPPLSRKREGGDRDRFWRLSNMVKSNMVKSNIVKSRAYIPNELGGIHYPAEITEVGKERLARSVWNWGKIGGFLPGIAGKKFFNKDGTEWDPRSGGGHPDFDYHIGPFGEHLDYYGKVNDLDPETWMLGLDLDATEHRHMTGVGWPPPGEGKEASFWDKLMFWKSSKSEAEVGNGGSGDDWRIWKEEDENGNGPGDKDYKGYNITYANGTTEFVPPPKEVSLDYYVMLDNGSFQHVIVPPGEKRTPQYDNMWIRFHSKMLGIRKVMSTPAGGVPGELCTYGPVKHIVEARGVNTSDKSYRDPRNPDPWD